MIDLPGDSAALKAMVLSLLTECDHHAQRAEQQAQRAEQQTQRADEQTRRAEELRVEMLRLQLELERYKKWYYGPRADRLQSTGDLAQMLFDFAASMDQKPVHPDDVPPETPQDSEVRRVRRRKGRRNLANFENLPATTHVHELSAEQRACPCCGTERQEIGADESWQIEYLPGHFERIHHVRKKYACTACENGGGKPSIETAAKPEAAIDKGLAGPGLLAYIVTSKFSDYLPLYRLEDIFARQGFEISRATQSVWCGDVADLAEPLYQLMAQRVRSSHVVATDDTIMPMLSKGKTANARMWIYVGDDDHAYNVFDFTLNRGRDGPKHFLKDYRQVLLADAYGGYNGVVAGNEITRAGCWAHFRRKVVEAEKAAPEIARSVVEVVRALYSVERQAAALPVAERLKLRQENSVPVVTELREKLLGWKEQLLPKHPMAEALNYALSQWAELTVFCSDGAVPLDNNISEREMKRVVLNRKNSLFVGNARGGRTAAILASLTSTCRRHDVDPQLYLTQLLTNLPSVRLSDLADWLPDAWKRRQAASPEGPPK
ncbi:IS66 family transposase [uncultured Paludibaculum sp.]|uniref:IS66 family transposase n=1 Tax=uncultured Paludibaculum sp. TaxID=1765020 RepID=UPI002AAC3AE0|nr:IS66 family transposase [uncultured Paludibaculum sp.]